MLPPSNQLAYIHGEYIRNVGGDKDHCAYVACLKDLKDGKSYLKIIDNPEQAVYVTKPQYRVNTAKKELEEKSRLDMYRTKCNHIHDTLWNAINNPGRWKTPPGYIHPKKMLSSPYVYGADIDFGVILKIAYKKANGNQMPLSYNVGLLDIETDVNGTNQIILITFMNGDGQTFVAILKEFYLDHTIEEAQKLWMKVEKDLKSKLNKKGLAAYEQSGGININFHICENEVELLKWTFNNIHACKPDFIGIWNMDYDIPYILKRCEFRNIDPKSLFCSSEIPYKYQECRYKPDKGKKGDHIVDRWHWLHCTSYTRWVDMMTLYGRLRKAKPREPSYKLDAIGGKEIGTGKLAFGEGEDHFTMQRFHQVEYTVYNIVDVLIMRIMELKNNDVRNMMMLIGVSTLDCFAHQSVQLKNKFYDYLDGKNCVPAAIGDPIDDKWDYLIKNKGGAVLSPDKAEIAVPTMLEDDSSIRGTRWVCDIDVSLTHRRLLRAIVVEKLP